MGERCRTSARLNAPMMEEMWRACLPVRGNELRGKRGATFIKLTFVCLALATWKESLPAPALRKRCESNSHSRPPFPKFGSQSKPAPTPHPFPHKKDFQERVAKIGKFCKKSTGGRSPSCFIIFGFGDLKWRRGFSASVSSSTAKLLAKRSRPGLGRRNFQKKNTTKPAMEQRRRRGKKARLAMESTRKAAFRSSRSSCRLHGQRFAKSRLLGLSLFVEVPSRRTGSLFSAHTHKTHPSRISLSPLLDATPPPPPLLPPSMH